MDQLDFCKCGHCYLVWYAFDISVSYFQCLVGEDEDVLQSKCL